MYYYENRNAAASKIAVTSTATSIYALINTASGLTPAIPRAGFPVDTNAIDLVVEDGSIRVLWDGNTPTASNGVLLGPGTYYFRGAPLENLLLIRTGSSNVNCSVMLGKSDRSESTNGFASFEGSTTTIVAPVDGSESASEDNSAAAEASGVAKASAGLLLGAFGYINASAATGLYYFQLFNLTAVPADGVAPSLSIPVPINHTNGTPTIFNLDLGEPNINGLPATVGISWSLSSTQFTKTITGAIGVVSILYK